MPIVRTVKGEAPKRSSPRAKATTGQLAPSDDCPAHDHLKSGKLLVVDGIFCNARRPIFQFKVEAQLQQEATGEKETVTAGEGSPVKKLRHATASSRARGRGPRPKLTN